MIILGIDPGTVITGYGVIQVEGQSETALDYGCIRPPSSMKLSDRYLVIFEGIEQLIDQFNPSAVAVETQYVRQNPQTALKLGMARGAVIIAAKRKKIPVYEYAPTQAKLAVVGRGSASKEQVLGMVQRLFSLPEPPKPQDAADALALAVCHQNAIRRKLALQEL